MLLTLGLDHIITKLLKPHHFGEEIGRMLSIPVEHHNDICIGVVESGGQGSLMAKVPAQLQYMDIRVPRSQRGQDFLSAIG